LTVEIIDYFSFAGTYPFGAPGSFGFDQLLSEMSADGIGHSYVTDLGSAYLKDPTEANFVFVEKCRNYADRLTPLPVIDLSVNTFEKDIRELHDVFGIKGVRIAPNYHGYRLDADLSRRLVGLLSELRLMLFVAKELEDVRFQPACLGARALTLPDLEPLLGKKGELKIILNNFGPAEIAEQLPPYAVNVFFDVAAFGGSFYAMERLMEERSPSQFVFGSHLPFLYRAAALNNLRNSLLCPADVEAILKGIEK